MSEPFQQRNLRTPTKSTTSVSSARAAVGANFRKHLRQEARERGVDLKQLDADSLNEAYAQVASDFERARPATARVNSSVPGATAKQIDLQLHLAIMALIKKRNDGRQRDQTLDTAKMCLIELAGEARKLDRKSWDRTLRSTAETNDLGEAVEAFVEGFAEVFPDLPCHTASSYQKLMNVRAEPLDLKQKGKIEHDSERGVSKSVKKKRHKGTRKPRTVPLRPEPDDWMAKPGEQLAVDAEGDSAAKLLHNAWWLVYQTNNVLLTCGVGANASTKDESDPGVDMTTLTSPLDETLQKLKDLKLGAYAELANRCARQIRKSAQDTVVKEYAKALRMKDVEAAYQRVERAIDRFTSALTPIEQYIAEDSAHFMFKYSAFPEYSNGIANAEIRLDYREIEPEYNQAVLDELSQRSDCYFVQRGALTLLSLDRKFKAYPESIMSIVMAGDGGLNRFKTGQPVKARSLDVIRGKIAVKRAEGRLKRSFARTLYKGVGRAGRLAEVRAVNKAGETVEASNSYLLVTHPTEGRANMKHLQRALSPWKVGEADG